MSSPAQLHYVICDLWGAHLAGGELLQHEAGQVEIPLNDLTTGEATIDLYDPAGALAKPPLQRILKAWYTPTKALHPIFCGPILTPTFSGSEETVNIAAVGTEYRLSKAVLSTPLSVVNRDIGEAMWDLIGRAITRTYPGGAPGLGIARGTVQPTYAINRDWDAGQNIWDALIDLSQLAGAPDMQFAPVDQADGTLCVFNALYPLGADRSSTVHFEYGTGTDNCADMVSSPGGDAVYTRFYEEGSVPDDGSLVAPIHVAWHPGQEAAVGIYEGWDSPDTSDAGVLQAAASMQVGAYHNPPNFIDVTPQYEGSGSTAAGSPPRWDVDYGLGDTVHAVGRKGTLAIDEAARVMKVTVGETEKSESPEVKVALELAPTVDTSGVSVI